jgi:hypothetical protein
MMVRRNSAVQPKSSDAAIATRQEHTVRSLFSKFQSVNHPIISDFIASIPETFSDAVKRISLLTSPSSSLDSNTTVVNDFILNNRIKLKPFIEKFHLEANTLTTTVNNNITFLDDPTTQILVSTHQPNLFAYSGIFKKIILLETLKRKVMQKHNNNSNKRIINLFLIIDHDFMEDTWIHLAQLPSIRHSLGILELRLRVSNPEKWKMVCNMPVPGRTVLDYWRKQVKSWIKNCLSAAPLSSSLELSDNNNKSRILHNFEEFWREVEESYTKAKSYSDLNSFLMSQLVNRIWGYDTLFVRLSNISSVFEDGFKYLISNFSTYSEALRKAENIFMQHSIDTGVSPSSYLNAPVWLHCKCGSKASAKIHKTDHREQQILLIGTCMSCKKELQINLGNQDKFDLLKGGTVNNLSPRAIPILLLLSRDLGVACFASGTGGSMGYTIVGSMAFKELSINMPLVIVWPSKDIYNGLGQSEALGILQVAKQSDVIAYLEVLRQRSAEYENKIKPLITERAQRMKTGKSIEALLSDLFALKEEQRKIRQLIKVAEKVRNAVEMSPCFIDYAINFGMRDAEIQWSNNLLSNDNLAAPIIMTNKKGDDNEVAAGKKNKTEP